jgi:hypothetical protein
MPQACTLPEQQRMGLVGPMDGAIGHADRRHAERAVLPAEFPPHEKDFIKNCL